MRNAFTTILILIFFNQLFAQKTPEWVYGVKPQSITGNFIYEIGIGTDNVIDSAQNKAFYNLIEKLSAVEGETYQVERVSQMNLNEKKVNGEFNSKSNFAYSSTVISKGKKVTKYIQEVGYYWNGKEYYGLYRVTDFDNKLNSPVYIYKKGLALIPGAAQFNKEEKTKGLMILSGELLCITGIVVSQVMYTNSHNDYVTYLNNGDIINADISKSNRDNIGIVRSISIIGAGGLYLYNVLDGFISKGKPQYAQKIFKLCPYLAYNNLGMSLTIKIK